MPLELTAKNLANPIRISIPASVAYNLDSFKSSISELVEVLGCRACFSGFDCHFLMERNYIVDYKANVQPTKSFASGSDMGSLSIAATLSSKTAYNLEAVHSAIDRLSDLTGCPCHSGLDISFQRVIEEFSF